MNHAHWQRLRDQADTAGDAMHNAQKDLMEWLELNNWKRDPDPLAQRYPWIDPMEGGHFSFEASVLLEEGRDGK